MLRVLVRWKTEPSIAVNRPEPLPIPVATTQHNPSATAAITACKETTLTP